eukprot:TRINITY_DN15366_c1_g2_i2.p1 TRINITY_DN15366_c1_g2~~TRINITY_DN15366_c1_g2_i2.p1  ORF type:complete len:298 (-),score=21.33 TRINITY_DN15366_c1_g2_i2:263-1156(-)
MDENLKRGILSNMIGWIVLGSISAALGLEKFALISLGINYAVFLLHALPQKSEKFFDATGSITYLSLTVCAFFFSHEPSMRQVVNLCLVAVWCIRLGTFLLARILRDGKDSRFDDFKENGLRFLGVWTIQSIWCFVVASPALVIAASQACATVPGPYDFAGWGTWLFGFVFEVIADRQKSDFRNDPKNKGRFINTGLWAYSRHPNYFGEITMWIGICISGSGCFQRFEWLAWLSPVTTWLLLSKVSGVPMLEAKGEKTWGNEPAYQWYMKHTPCFVPALCRPPPYSSVAASLLQNDE